MFVGGSRASREEAIRRTIGDTFSEEASAWEWPFRRHVTPQMASPPSVIWIRDLHEAFSAQQSPGTRLVLTQSTYQLQRWLDWLDNHPDVVVVADGDVASLERGAPEAFARRGPWSRIAVEKVPEPGEDQAVAGPRSELHAAFLQSDPDERYTVAMRTATASPDDGAVHLACASAAMECLRLDDARGWLDRARRIAPDWEAIAFEMGKWHLRCDDTAAAAEAFAEAGRLMPSFAAAFGNLGAALGELERYDAAVAALEHALRFDPLGHTLLNNLGAVWRDIGRLDRAEATFREVTALQPAFVFGHYNLAHTLFLQGRFVESCDEYAAALARDPQRNARQQTRSMVARAAAGDIAGALAEADALAFRVPQAAMLELMEEAESTLRALSTLSGLDQAGIARVLERLAAIPRS